MVRKKYLHVLRPLLSVEWLRREMAPRAPLEGTTRGTGAEAAEAARVALHGGELAARPFPPLRLQALLADTANDAAEEATTDEFAAEAVAVVSPSARRAVLALVEPPAVRADLAKRLPRVAALDTLVEALLARASALAKTLQV